MDFFSPNLMAAHICPISYCHKLSWFALEPELTSTMYEHRKFSIKLSNSNSSQFFEYSLQLHIFVVVVVVFYFLYKIPNDSNY